MTYFERSETVNQLNKEELTRIVSSERFLNIIHALVKKKKKNKKLLIMKNLFSAF